MSPTILYLGALKEGFVQKMKLAGIRRYAAARRWEVVPVSKSQSVPAQVPAVDVAAGATLKVSSAEAISSLSGAGTAEVSRLAELTVDDMSGFSGSLAGYGKVTVLNGSSFDKQRISVADTLKVHVTNLPMVIVVK